MFKKILPVIAVFGMALLAGCGQQKITTPQRHYAADGMVAVVKGTAPHNEKITATIAGKKTEKVTNHDGNFVYTVAPTTQAQQVVFHSGSAKRAITVAASAGFGQYAAFAQKYNFILLQMNNPQKKDTSAQSSSSTQASTPAAKQAEAAMKAQMAQAANQQKGALPLTAAEGIHNLATIGQTVVRVNVQDKQLIGLTTIVPTSVLKNKKEAASFITTFSLIASTMGADAKNVLKDFQKQQKDAQSSQTTMKTIVSKNVHFNIGFSPTKLYIYITR
jgi:hypothetical protein